MSGWTVAWILWLAMFAVIELPALLNKQRGDTLSETIWDWFKIRDKPRQWTVRRAVLAGFLTWLLVHMVAGI